MEMEAFTSCMLDVSNVMDLPIRVISTDKETDENRRRLR